MKEMTLNILLSFLLLSCSNINRDKLVDNKNLTGDDYRLFQNTPAWELAKAVQDENEKKITEIMDKEPKLINYQEPKFGSTLLMVTIKNQQYTSFEILLKNKAEIDIHDNYEGSTALIEACSSEYYDLKFAVTLLQYGANVNDVQTDIEKQGKTRTPLMVASNTGNLDLVKLLVNKGADLNYQNEFKQSALSEAIMTEWYNIAFYLLENGADYKKPIFFREDQNREMYLVDVLREDFFGLGTDEYKYKMQIVEFLKSKGIDYRATPIPDYIKKKAQEEYPKTWQKYLEKY
jgi:hypothetical protein